MLRRSLMFSVVPLLLLSSSASFAQGVSFERLRALGDSLTICTQGGAVSDHRNQVKSWVKLLANQVGSEMRLPLLTEMNTVGQQRRMDYPDYLSAHNYAYNGVSTDDTFMKVAPEIPAIQFGWAWNHLDLILADRPGYTMLSALSADSPTFVVGFLGSNDFMDNVMARGTIMEDIPTLGLMDQVDPLDASGMRPQDLFRSDFDTVVNTLYRSGIGMCFGTLPTLPDIPGILTKDELTAFIGENPMPDDCVTNYTVAAAVHGRLKEPKVFLDDRNYYTPTELQTINDAITGYNNTIRTLGADPAHPFAVVETPIQPPETMTGNVHVNGWRINNKLFIDNAGKPRASIMTTDGVHMSDIGNALCAQAYIRTINSYYGTSIPELNEAQLTAILNSDAFADNDADGKIEGISCNVAFLSLNFVYPDDTGDSGEVPLNAKLLTTQVTPAASGHVVSSAEGPEYFEGTGISLTAYPEDSVGTVFSHWEGDVPGGYATANPLSLTMDSHRTVVAVFDILDYTLTYTAGTNGAISGTTPQTVLHGHNGTAVTAVPDAGYHFVQWSDGVSTATRTDVNVRANINVTATFAINQYTLTYAAPSNGSVSGTTPQTVIIGTSGTPVTAVPDVGYHFVQWSDGVLTATRTDTNVTANINVTATFAINQYTLTYAAEANGSLSGSLEQTVEHGTNASSVTAVPDTGYHFARWSDGVTNAKRTDMNVIRDISVTAIFEINRYKLTYLAETNGAIEGIADQTVDHGSDGMTVTAIPNTGWHFVRWSDKTLTPSRTDTNITADKRVTAIFAINEYTLTYAAGANGSVSGISPQTVNHGSSGATVTAVPDENYHFTEWSDGVLTAARRDTNVAGDISVTAMFAIDQHTLTYTAGMNGTVVGPTPQTVDHGSDGAPVTATPNTGYHFVRWSDGVLTATRTDTNATFDIGVTATFEINRYTLRYAVGSNGALEGMPLQTVLHGTSGTQVIAKPDAGYHFVQWSDGVLTTARTDAGVTSDIDVIASFAVNQYTLTYMAAANGSISGETVQTINHGASGTMVTAIPGSGYYFIRWNDGIVTAERTDRYVVANLTATARFDRSRGTVVVEPTPDTASWTFFDGDGTLHSGTGSATVPNIPTGQISLAWNNLASHDTPEEPEPQILNRNGIAVFEGAYTRQTGSVLVDVTPDTATYVLFDGDSVARTYTGDQSLSDVPTGNIVVVYSDLPGYAKPIPATKMLTRNETVELEGVYHYQGPTAAFTADTTEGYAPLVVIFTDQSDPGPGAITRWTWNFGDGTGSGQQNPQHTFAESGSYEVSLIVETVYGTSSLVKTHFITVLESAEGVLPEGSPPEGAPAEGELLPPLAAFHAEPGSGDVPLRVQFTDLSEPGSAPVTSWTWDFGDESGSTEQNPEHVYLYPGVFTVSLIVNNEFGSDAEVKTNHISALTPPEGEVVETGPTAAFVASVTSGEAPLAVQFTDLSEPGSQPVTSWKWNFGDGSAESDLQNPVHTYSTGGVYTVSLVVQTSAGTASETKTGFIAVVSAEGEAAPEGETPKPLADFSGSPITGFAPLRVQFTDLSVSEGLPVLEWIWNFGDGSNSTEQAPTHVYEQAGSYTVTLIVRTAAGSSDPMVKSAYISVLPQVEGEVDLSELAGELLDSFSSLDTNNDSALSPDELRAAEHSVSDATFDRLDLNHDGAISQTELAGFVVEGEVPEGETVDGEIPMEGEPAEGQPAEGSAVEGQPADGEPPAEGEPGEGTAPEGETPGEGEPEPQRTEGEPADISAQSAFSCTGITG